MSTVLTAAILGTIVFLAACAITGAWLTAPPAGGHCAPDPSGLAGARARACARPHPEPDPVTAPASPASGAVTDPVPAGLWPAWDDGTWQPGTSATRTDLQVIAGTSTVVMDGRVVPRFYEQHWGTADGTAVINGSLDYREGDTR